jgi:hypothetical protein
MVGAGEAADRLGRSAASEVVQLRRSHAVMSMGCVGGRSIAAGSMWLSGLTVIDVIDEVELRTPVTGQCPQRWS